MEEFKNVKILDYDVPTRTGKIYTKECILNALKDMALRERIHTGSMFGFLESTDMGVTNAAFSVTSLKATNTSLYADIKLLNTPYGKISKNLLEQGMPLALGLRGQGATCGNIVICTDIDSIDLLISKVVNNNAKFRETKN